MVVAIGIVTAKSGSIGQSAADRSPSDETATSQKEMSSRAITAPWPCSLRMSVRVTVPVHIIGKPRSLCICHSCRMRHQDPRREGGEAAPDARESDAPEIAISMHLS